MYTSLYPSDDRHPDPLQLDPVGPCDSPVGILEMAIAGVGDDYAGTIACISLIPADKEQVSTT
jgi:hypothetical protein